MGSIGCALAFGPINDIGVTGIGFALGDLVEELHASLLAHPSYPGLFDRAVHETSDTDRAIDDYLGTHDALAALCGRGIDPSLSGELVDLADRARTVAGASGFDARGKRVRASERRCVVLLAVSMDPVGDAIICGAGARLGLAFSNAVGSLRDHPLLAAFSEHRPATLAELERLSVWSDPVISELVLETEID